MQMFYKTVIKQLKMSNPVILQADWDASKVGKKAQTSSKKHIQYLNPFPPPGKSNL